MEEMTVIPAIPVVWAWIVGICAGIVSIAKAVEIVKKASGRKEISEKIHDIETKLDNNDRRLADMEKAQRKSEEANGIMFRTLLSITAHMRTGNDVRKLQDAENEMQAYLTRR